MLPILWEHDHTRPIGTVEVADDGTTFKFRFNENVLVSEQAMFEIFGHAGIRVTEQEVLPDGTRLIKAGQIMEFSFCVG